MGSILLSDYFYPQYLTYDSTAPTETLWPGLTRSEGKQIIINRTMQNLHVDDGFE